jgi:hypothetical protein
VETLYSNEVRSFINSRDWPKGLLLEVRENDFPQQHLNIVFFRHNWLTLTAEDQIRTTEIVREVIAKLWADGIPTYTGKME